MIRIRSLPAGCTANAPILPINNRREGGKRAKRAGDALEHAIMRGAAQGGLVRLTKLPSCGARFIGKDRAIREPMPTDFVGSVIGSGRFICFDAKSAGEDSASLRVNADSIVKPHQRDFLIVMAEAGALSGLLVESKRTGFYLWLDAVHLNEGAPIRWDDPRWKWAGAILRHVDFSKLVGDCK